MSNELLLEGRMVCGHPMVRRAVKKKQRGEPVETQVFNDDGTPTTDVYLALAIPKNGSVDWKQTPWGQQIHSVGVVDWPNGEHAAVTFAWKITDGDSQVPNKVGKKPADREGWAGHWVIHLTTQWGLQCFHVGKYDPMIDQIQDKAEIKAGDYARVFVNIKGNGPIGQSPGIYINPKMFELSRAGQLIVSESGPAAADVFGGGGQPATQPQVQQQPVQQQQTPQAPIAPATDFVNGPGTTAAAPPPPPPPAEPKYVDAIGGHFTAAQLAAAGYSPEQIAALPKVQ